MFRMCVCFTFLSDLSNSILPSARQWIRTCWLMWRWKAIGWKSSRLATSNRSISVTAHRTRHHSTSSRDAIAQKCALLQEEMEPEFSVCLLVISCDWISSLRASMALSNAPFIPLLVILLPSLHVVVSWSAPAWDNIKAEIFKSVMLCICIFNSEVHWKKLYHRRIVTISLKFS